jgi:hypothetical protein
MRHGGASAGQIGVCPPGPQGTVISASPLSSPLANVENAPVAAPSVQPADNPCGLAVFRAGWIKNVGTLLAVQNAYGRDVDIGSFASR